MAFVEGIVSKIGIGFRPLQDRKKSSVITLFGAQVSEEGSELARQVRVSKQIEGFARGLKLTAGRGKFFRHYL